MQRRTTKWMAVAIVLELVVLAASAAPAGGRDTLVFKDGDRVQGTLIENAAGTLVFRSDRFGELRVPAGDAVVIKAAPAVPPAVAATPKPAAVAAAPAARTPTPADADEQLSLWEHFSPAALTARVRSFFGPWRGRLAFSTDIVNDSAERYASSGEAHFTRRWTADEVQLHARHDFSETNDVATTDLVKAWGQWRREFGPHVFAHYRPTAEWNRASKLRGVPNDYVLLQQEVGAGWQLPLKAGRKARVGVSQNFFDTWNSAPGAGRVSRGVISAFEETELTLPWRMTFAQRGVWYPAGDQGDGWENRIDLNKKLTETLSTSLRHEIRRNNPDGTAQDYTRLKWLFGLDF